MTSAATYVEGHPDMLPLYRARVASSAAAGSQRPTDSNVGTVGVAGGDDAEGGGGAEEAMPGMDVGSSPASPDFNAASPAGSDNSTYISFGVGSDLDCNVPSELERSMFDLEASMVQYSSMPSTGDHSVAVRGDDIVDYVAMNVSQLLNDEVLI